MTLTDLAPGTFRIFLTLMAADPASPLTEEQRRRIRARTGNRHQPAWWPTVHDCGVEVDVLQQWFDRLNGPVRLYVSQALATTERL